MKNKKMVYILGLLVLIVWGLIAYRIFSTVNHDNDYIAGNTEKFAKEKYDDYAMTKDTCHLLLNYRNPFDALLKPDTIRKIKPDIVAVVNVPKTPFNWNFIKYNGFIRNPDTKGLIAILTINGKNAMLAEGETAENVKLLKNLKDSVKIIFKNKTKFITMNTASL